MSANRRMRQRPTARRSAGPLPRSNKYQKVNFNMQSITVSQFFENIRVYHTGVDDKFKQPKMIISKLRAYQCRAVKWMIDRENNNNLVKSDGSAFSGGILADEIGLGKTIEMLCCIVANPSPPEFHNKKIEFADSKNDTQNISIPTTSKISTSKYTSTKSKKQTVKITKDEVNLTIECCINTLSDKSLVVCVACEKTLYASCVHVNPKLIHEVPILCANCWTFTDIIQCKATLIVVPQSVKNQWIEEIQKHIKKRGFNVLIYNGMLLDGCYQPISFNNYDVVITTYTTLSNDTYYVGNNLKNGRTSWLKHSKKCNYLTNPLFRFKWWRICIDKCPASKFKLVTSLQSVHRWTMTGTPVKKSFEELYYHLRFLDVSPYCDRKQFSLLMKGKADLVYKWFSKILWRNSVYDVKSEFNLPKVTTENNWLTHSDNERYFYNLLHDKFTESLLEWQSNIWIPINKPEITTNINVLRQACMHPQNFDGQFLKVKFTMTMEKYVDEMIKKCRVECNDLLHSLVSKHRKMAGIYKKQSKYTSANNHCLNIVRLQDEYRKKNIQILKSSSKLKTGADGPPMKKRKLTKNDTNQKKDLKIDISLSEENLKKKAAILLYYENLKRGPLMSSETECQICSFNFGSEWAVLQCGHSLCKTCLANIGINSGKFYIDCPFCRSEMTLDSLNYVKSDQEEGSNIEMKGSFSTKIGNITKKLMELIVQDPKVKVLIFSTWERTLRILGEALEQNSVNFRILENGTEYKRVLRDFKTDENINALLMQLSLVSKGLNLTEATRIFFIEPIIHEADQYQAISIIHRPGQTKPTFVHHFIIRDSIEESIRNILSNNRVKWDNILLTPKISRLFERSRSNDNNSRNIEETSSSEATSDSDESRDSNESID